MEIQILRSNLEGDLMLRDCRERDIFSSLFWSYQAYCLVIPLITKLTKSTKLRQREIFVEKIWAKTLAQRLPRILPSAKHPSNSNRRHVGLIVRSGARDLFRVEHGDVRGVARL